MKVSDLGKPQRQEKSREVEFARNDFSAPNRTNQPSQEGAFLTRLVIRIGLAKTPAQAQIVLGIIAVLAVILTVVLAQGQGETPLEVVGPAGEL